MHALAPLAGGPFSATLLVALGGAVGAALRYQSGRLVTAWAGPVAAGAFPWATLTVNVAGSLCMGLLAGWLARGGLDSGAPGEALRSGAEQWRLLLGTGLLGGFTTFSAFSLELMVLIERGQAGLALGYAAASVLAGLGALWLGLVLMRAGG